MELGARIHMTTTPQERIRQKLTQLYDADDAQQTYEDLQQLLTPVREGDPTTLSLTERDVLLICYGDHLQAPHEAPLQTLHHFLRERVSDVINGVHLLPFFPYSSDDGFSVIDYTAVDENLGEWSHIRAMSEDFRLMFDAVFNHISSESEWFQQYLQGEAPYDDYFIAVAPDTDLSQVVRPRAKPLLTAFDTVEGTKHLWTTFSEDQIDLNLKAPAVLVDLIRILRFYVEQGAELIRLDAIGFLWKEIGTTCIHLPQTHTIIQLMRDVLDIIAPDTVIITETNVPHEENISYFGDGTNEAQMVYQFPLPPLVLHTLATGDATVLTAWAQSLGQTGEQVTFFNFTASHDGIGLRPATGLIPDEAVLALAERTRQHGGQVSYKTNADGSESPYELNITYFDAINPPQLTQDNPEQAIARFMVSQAIMLALRGVPGIYFSSLFGERNWQAGVQQTGRARTINRRKFQRDALQATLNDETALPTQIFTRYQHLLHIRTTQPALHPLSTQTIHDLSPAVVAIERGTDETRLLALHNVTAERVTVALPVTGNWHDLLAGDAAPYTQLLTLAPYQICWLVPVADEG